MISQKKMISKRKVFSFNLPWNIHHKSLQHYFKYTNKWRRSVMVINGKWWIYSKSKKNLKLCLSHIFKKSSIPRFFEMWYNFKMSAFVPIHKLLISNLYIVLTKTNINLSAEWQPAGETSIYVTMPLSSYMLHY